MKTRRMNQRQLKKLCKKRAAIHANPVKKMVRVLTDEAEAEAADFYMEYGDSGCTCFICPPCSSCTHPGNPLNQENDETAWREVPA